MIRTMGLPLSFKSRGRPSLYPGVSVGIHQGLLTILSIRYEGIAAVVDSGESESIRPFCYG